MGFFNRKLPEPQMGMFINAADYQVEIGSRPGIPQDGRYFVALIESNGEVDRLVWEQPATYQEAKALIKDFEKTYGKKAKRVNEARIDDVAGLWAIEPRGKPFAMLSVFHPIQLRSSTYYE